MTLPVRCWKGTPSLCGASQDVLSYIVLSGGRETPLARAEGFLFPPIFYELKMLYVREGGNRRNGPRDRRGSDALPEAHALAYTARVFRLPVGQPVFSYWDVFPQGWGLLRDNRKKYGFCQQYMQLYALSHR